MGQQTSEEREQASTALAKWFESQGIDKQDSLFVMMRLQAKIFVDNIDRYPLNKLVEDHLEFLHATITDLTYGKP